MGDKRPQRVEEQPKKKQKQKAEEEKFEEEKAMPSGVGKQRVGGENFHYQAFELEGVVYRCGNYVKIVPKDKNEECYVAFIKDIWQKDGSMVVKVQRFYKCFLMGFWRGFGDRELVYSLDCFDIPAEEVFCSCWVLFFRRWIPISEIPEIGKPVAYIVRVFDDVKEKKLVNVDDERYKDNELLQISYHFQLTNIMLQTHAREMEMKREIRNRT